MSQIGYPGVAHRTALAMVKRFNRLLCGVKGWRYRSLIRSRHLSSQLPEVQRIMILAPHMDDEAIGCAGLIDRYSGLGADIVCVYLTDGGGNRTGTDRISRTAERMRETRAACRRIGIQRPYFLNQPDGQLTATPTVIDELQSIMDREVPQLLLLPYPCDPHPDHRATVSIAAMALHNPPPDLRILYYQLRAPIPLDEIELVIDTSDFFDTKRELLYSYHSQAEFVFDLALHLQHCQGVLLDHKPKMVEVFSAVDLDRLTDKDCDESPIQVRRHLQVGTYALHRRQERSR